MVAAVVADGLWIHEYDADRIGRSVRDGSYTLGDAIKEARRVAIRSRQSGSSSYVSGERVVVDLLDKGAYS